MLCFKQKTAYELRISDWSSDLFSSDLLHGGRIGEGAGADLRQREAGMLCGEDEVRGQRQLEAAAHRHAADRSDHRLVEVAQLLQAAEAADTVVAVDGVAASRRLQVPAGGEEPVPRRGDNGDRSEEHTSE